jgi:hypothetical protein
MMLIAIAPHELAPGHDTFTTTTLGLRNRGCCPIESEKGICPVGLEKGICCSILVDCHGAVLAIVAAVAVAVAVCAEACCHPARFNNRFYA